jgi:hypothetical protein
VSLKIFRCALGLGCDLTADFNCDGTVMATDLSFWIPHAGQACESALDVDPAHGAPVAFALHPCLPNPALDQTLVRFDLPMATTVSLGVLDVAGRRVRAAFAGTPLPAGRHEWVWNGRDESGARAKPGVYFFTLSAPGIVRTTRMVLLR